jgi:hypothetical protein
MTLHFSDILSARSACDDRLNEIAGWREPAR